MISFLPLTGVVVADYSEGPGLVIQSTIHVHSSLVVAGSVTIAPAGSVSSDGGGREGEGRGIEGRNEGGREGERGKTNEEYEGKHRSKGGG